MLVCYNSNEVNDICYSTTVYSTEKHTQNYCSHCATKHDQNNFAQFNKTNVLLKIDQYKNKPTKIIILAQSLHDTVQICAYLYFNF